ncbi:hypothetical protein BEWA_021420 [Theileria equi strain WA]|uniref:UBA domain-containing protein n=1 Tax=Theileria equi strain WA TaxID=1537102 RepID=L0AWK9_THEEQ|nr:hypothetical protein BEWA_021420 [Theileria equi strain WA]AFZ79294.1 hypothetical protein BEWA_021420 [Theileria equi strain WA]|eukprot:XP_004828960.1 hypothetical protein BEWA_021420 [Theileria equi strain WA]
MTEKGTENNNELLKDNDIPPDATKASNSGNKAAKDAEKYRGERTSLHDTLKSTSNRPITSRSTSSSSSGAQTSSAQNSQSRKELAQQKEATRLLREITSDPEIMDQALSAAVNPNVARELARQADTAWRNIEALPGGFRALCRMHHNIQKPLWQAVIGQDAPNKPKTGNNSNNGIPINEPLDAQPLPNPWRSDFNAPASNSSRFGSLGFNPFGPTSSLFSTGSGQTAGTLGSTSIASPFSFNTNSFQSASQIAESSASKYSKEIAEMAEMGLTDRDKCLTALEAAEGDLFQAIGIIQSLDELDNEENNEK